MTRFNSFLFSVCIAISMGVNAQSFSPPEYILENTGIMRVAKSHIPGDSVILYSLSQPVNLNDPELQHLISSMYRTVSDSLSRGVGIAAPQVAVNKRVILVQRFDKPNDSFEAYLNPSIIQFSTLTEIRPEGCLSIDDYRCEVERSYAILLHYFTIDGIYRIEMVEGYTARIFQHEIDHLDGILFTEREKRFEQ